MLAYKPKLMLNTSSSLLVDSVINERNTYRKIESIYALTLSGADTKQKQKYLVLLVDLATKLSFTQMKMKMSFKCNEYF